MLKNLKPVVTSCHGALLQIGAWSGVKHLDEMAHLVGLRYSRCPIGAYEGG